MADREPRMLLKPLVVPGGVRLGATRMIRTRLDNQERGARGHQLT